jgi:long-chain fatty acid transport protein
MTTAWGRASRLITVGAIAISGLYLGSPGQASASGYAIREDSAEALGTAFAGNASSATFLSTIFNNPAGMTYFTGDRAQADGSLIDPTFNYSASASETCFHCSQVFGPGTAPIGGRTSGEMAKSAFVPAGYFLHSITPDLKIGLALTAPFGLATQYSDDWVGRYFGIKSAVRSIDINPNIAYRITDNISVGAGISAQYMYADFTSAIDLNALAFPPLAPVVTLPPGSVPDGKFEIKGSDWAVGYNFGAIYDTLQGTRLGIAYRSRVEHTLTGNATFSNIPFPASLLPNFASSGGKASITNPDNVDVSVTQQITEKFRLAGDVQWTDWSLFKSLNIQRSNGTLIQSTPENWHDTVFVSIGGTYNYDDNWTFRAGFAYDQSPVSQQDITVRLPDADRYWLSTGVGYKISEGISVDAAYTHIFMPSVNLDGSANNTIAYPTGAVDAVRASYSNSIELASLQARFKF